MTIELVTTLIPIFQFIGTILDIPSQFYVVDVPADWILYGCGFIGITLEAYYEFVNGGQKKMSELAFNFTANTSTYAVNITDLMTNGVPVQVCIQTQEQLAWNNRMEILFILLCFLLAIDVIMTIVKWQIERRKL